MENKNKQLTLFNVVEKIENSTTTITELRIPIFSPVQKLSGNSVTAREFKKNGGIRTVETSWGKVEIRGRKLLTQVHRDLLDCIYTHATKILPLPTEEVVIIFSQTKILKEYSGEEKSKSWETQTKWLKEKIKEIRDVTINYVNTKGDSFDFNLISHLDYLEEHRAYSITLDNRYLKFYERELSINYKKELPKLLKVDQALIKAIIRWFFTHKKVSRFKLMTVFEALGFPIDSPKTLQVAKREVASKVELFHTFGIDYDPKEEMFHYLGNDSVGFMPSLFSRDQKVIENVNVVTKKTIHDLMGESIRFEGNEDIIKKISYETEGAFVCAAYIETENNRNFRITNKSDSTEDEFEMEVILQLEALLYKE
ncbi:MAG: hypothetical protein L0Y61_04630 [Epsilonproteobacteria bacterium]|nr:hypothetical protein [Campylobacterota bacterium]